MSDQLQSALAFAGLAVSITTGIYLPAKAQIRKDRAARLEQAEKHRQVAVEAATAPLKEKISELQRSNTAALETQAEIWQGRVADRDRQVVAITAERDHYRDLWDNRDQSEKT